MLKITLDREYRAAIYLRLSKEDGDFSISNEKTESNSISNQRLLIMDYVKGHPEITVIAEYVDDGYTGSNFDRPQFKVMMDAVRDNKIDCIIVKDLSRFGREYIEAGTYIQKIFPALGVRFIAINDNYDNAQPGAMNNEIILPFKNLINDSYCRDISIKVRSNLDVKRRNGQFVGSRVTYGYLRSPDDKHQLIIDPEAAKVVQDIFRWKIEGQSPDQIADRLNCNGVLSPIEYKKANGSKQRTCFQTRKQALWSAVAIYRILSNEIYTGVLLQGKTTTPNHKIKKRRKKDESEWSRNENTHDAIISRTQFALVQKIMKEDTRRPVGEDTVRLFSGKVYCADCQSSMVRKTTKSNGKEYAYLICSGNKQHKDFCSSHMIRESVVYDAVLAVLQAQIIVALDVASALQQIDDLAWENRELNRLQEKITQQECSIDKYKRLKTDAYADYRLGILTQDEYTSFRDEFDQRMQEAINIISRLRDEQDSISSGIASQHGWLEQFKKYENIHELTRNIVVNLVDRITINEDKSIDVQLIYGDQLAVIADFLKEERKDIAEVS